MISKDKREKIGNEDMKKKTNSGWLSLLMGFSWGGSKQEKTSVDIQAKGFSFIFIYLKYRCRRQHFKIFFFNFI